MSTIRAAAAPVPAPARILHATYQHLVAYTGAAAGGEQSLVIIVAAVPPSSCSPAQEGGNDEDATTALGYETINVLSIAPAAGTSISLLALGGHHLAVGLLLKSSGVVKKKSSTIEIGPTMVHFYSLFHHHHKQQNVKLEVDYSAPILQLCLNQQFAAVLLEANQGEGRASPLVLLHVIDDDGGKDQAHGKKYHQSDAANVFRKQQWFGGADDQQQGGAAITCIALTDHFLFFGNSRGEVHVFSLAEWSFLPLPPPSAAALAPLQSIHPNSMGTRVLCIESGGGRGERGAFLYNPTAHVASAAATAAAAGAVAAFLRLPEFPSPAQQQQQLIRVMWDLVDRHVILVQDGADNLHTYVYAVATMAGPAISKVGTLNIVSEEGDVTMQPQVYPFPASKYGIPILSHEGRLLCVGARKANIVVAPMYSHIISSSSGSPSSSCDVDATTQQFKQHLALLHLNEAKNTLMQQQSDNQSRSFWLALSGKASEVMDVETALAVYRTLGDVGMVRGLEQIQDIEDRNLLAGHIALLFGQYQQAEDLFLASSDPLAAVDMRRDLLQYLQALKLAQQLLPQDDDMTTVTVTEIALQYAYQLEMQDADYEGALRMYEMARERLSGSTSREMGSGEIGAAGGGGEGGEGACLSVSPLMSSCNAGYARCLLRIGHVRKGMAFLLELAGAGSGSHAGAGSEAATRQDSSLLALLQEGARILERTKATMPEAADLYKRAGKFERAAKIYILQLKDLSQAAPLMQTKITLPKLHWIYAKACEEEAGAAGGQQHMLLLAEAIRSYDKAHDQDSVIRLYLQTDPDKAFDMIRATSSITGALLAAKHCQEKSGDISTCLEFLFLAQQFTEAFEVAKTHQHVDTYTAQLLLLLSESSLLSQGVVRGDADQGNDKQQQQHIFLFSLLQKVAQYYEQSRVWAKAGRLYARMNQPSQALPLLLQGNAVEEAIEVVVAAYSGSRSSGGENGEQQQQAQLTQSLVAHLSEEDGPGKDLTSLGRLYMALGKYEEMACNALRIADEQQAQGNYQEARTAVYEALRNLEAVAAAKTTASKGSESRLRLQHRFVLLHSYALVKILIRHENHEGAARLLLRVAQDAHHHHNSSNSNNSNNSNSNNNNSSSSSSSSSASCLFPPKSQSQQQVQQVVRLLTLVVVQCQRVGLLQEAFGYASVLVTNVSYRNELDPAVRRKIETIVRRGGGGGGVGGNGGAAAAAVAEDDDDKMCATQEEALSRCPFCDVFLHLTQLYCHHGSDNGMHEAGILLPMCIVSGRHMERGDWCFCPNSGMPALYSEYLKYIDTERNGGKTGTAAVAVAVALDPICGKPITKNQLIHLAPSEVAQILANSEGSRCVLHISRQARAAHARTTTRKTAPTV